MTTTTTMANTVEPYDYSFGRKLRSRERNIVRLQDEVLAIRDTATRMKAGQTKEFRHHLAKLKAASWREAVAMQRDPDRTLRPPDRQMYVRPYTNMDRDLWYMDPLRAWFNKDEDSAKPWEGFQPLESGYVVKNTTPPVEPVRSLASVVPTPPAVKSQYDFRHRSPYVIPLDEAAGKRRTSVKPHAHWMNHEGLLQEQAQESLRKMEQRRYYPVQAPGHMPGCRRAPWRDMPPEEEDVNRDVKSHQQIMAFEDSKAAGLGLERYREGRLEASKMKLDMQKGSLSSF